MAIRSDRPTIGTTRVRVDPTRQGESIPRGSVTVRNRGTGPVSLGGEDVSIANGFELDPGDATSFDLGPGDALFGIAAEPQPCQVIQVGALA